MKILIERTVIVLVAYSKVFCHKKQENRYIETVVSFQLSVTAY